MGAMAAKQRRRRPAPGLSPAPGIPKPSGRQLAWIVCALTVFVFLPVLGNGFVNWDDDANFLDNPHFRGLGTENLEWMATTFQMGHYHPLTWLTLGLDYTVWGLNPAGYHLTNLLLHALASVLVYWLLLTLILKASRADEPDYEMYLGAAFGAVVFAIHPLRVESVAWASERRDVLSGVFYLATVLLYLRGRKPASLAFFAAALLSKVIVASLPIVLLVIDVYPLRRRFNLKLVLEKWPYFVMAFAAGMVALGRHEGGVAASVEHLDWFFALRVTLSLFALAFYVWKTFVPLGLYAQYAYSVEPQAFDFPLLIGSAFTVAVTVAAVALRKKYPAVPAVWVCYVVTLLPVLSFVRFDRQLYVADHHSYLATLGIAALLGWGLYRLIGVGAPTPALVVSLLVTLALAERTISQVSVWSDSETLWGYTLRGSPLSAVAQNNMGRALGAAGKYPEAAAYFMRATEIKQNYPSAHYNLGNSYMKLGRFEDAARSLERAIALDPAHAVALNDLGNVFSRQGKITEAIAAYERTIAVRPEHADAHYNLGLTLHRSGSLERAEASYLLAIELDSSNADALNNLGVLAESRGHLEQARGLFERALAVDPTHESARLGIARVSGVAARP